MCESMSISCSLHRRSSSRSELQSSFVHHGKQRETKGDLQYGYIRVLRATASRQNMLQGERLQECVSDALSQEEMRVEEIRLIGKRDRNCHRGSSVKKPIPKLFASI